MSMFSNAPWWNSPGKKTGFTPGPTKVKVVGQPAPAKPVSPPPAAPPAPNRIPQGNKGDCPVCNRGFGKKFGR